MSKSFLKVSEAYTKLGLSGGGTNWIRKSELIATGKCDTSLLEKYGNNDFVVDDDIILLKELPILFEYSGSSTGDNIKTLPRTFNPSKPFKITGYINFTNVSNGVAAGLTIYTYGGSGQDSNSQLDITLWYDSTTSNINNNTRKADGTWLSGNFVLNPVSNILNKFWSFDLDYDGITYKRTIGTSNYSDVVQLKDFECESICFTGSPWWNARSCSASIKNLVIRQ